VVAAGIMVETAISRTATLVCNHAGPDVAATNLDLASEQDGVGMGWKELGGISQNPSCPSAILLSKSGTWAGNDWRHLQSLRYLSAGTTFDGMAEHG